MDERRSGNDRRSGRDRRKGGTSSYNGPERRSLKYRGFGQEESSSHMDVARASARKMERIAVKMKSKDMIGNPYILKYLNRLSDLIFVLACFEEKEEEERRKISRFLLSSKWSDPAFRRWTIFTGLIILALVATITLLLLFHKQTPEVTPIKEHMEQMDSMHKPVEN